MTPPVNDLDVHAYRLHPGHPADLAHRPTRAAALFPTDLAYQAQLADHILRLRGLQERFYAAAGHALLVIVQGMDAAGKDGTIAHVMSGINPQGCDVTSFKQPSRQERKHDFLWRSNNALPERGKIAIFNRSYYEEVLILRVHPAMLPPALLAEKGVAQSLPPPKHVWTHRFRSINDLERHLHANGTQILKFYLHLSEPEQRKRFLARIDDPDRNWKLSASDLAERKFWPDYATAYEDCLTATSTHHAPWFIVPADEKDTSRLIVSQILLDALAALKPLYPQSTPARRRELQTIRAQLVCAPAAT